MKKIFGKILIMLLAIVMVLSVAGCNFIDNGDTENNVGNEENNDVEQTQTTDNLNKLVCNSSLINSATLTGGITYKSADHASSNADAATTIKNTQVNRASVVVASVFNSSIVYGSGVIIDIDDGVNYGDKEDNVFYIMTCHHVIDSCEGATHTFYVYVPDANGNNYNDEGYDEKFEFTGKLGGTDTNFAVTLIGGDKQSDVALLRLIVTDDTVASKIVKAKIMSDSNSVNLGETVFAIGNTEGQYAGWTTVGNIADTSCTQIINGIGKMNLLGINVDIYPGNSGGGLFNLYGEVVGITNAGETATGYGGEAIPNGINFAIPHKGDKGFISVIKQLLGTYLKAGNNYGYVSGRADTFWFSINSQMTVSSVVAGSVADGNIFVGDYINSVSVNGATAVSITNYMVLDDVLESAKVGDTLTFIVTRTVREGYWMKNKSYSVTLSVSQYYFCNTGNYTNIANV